MTQKFSIEVFYGFSSLKLNKKTPAPTIARPTPSHTVKAKLISPPNVIYPRKNAKALMGTMTEKMSLAFRFFLWIIKVVRLA